MRQSPPNFKLCLPCCQVTLPSVDQTFRGWNCVNESEPLEVPTTSPIVKTGNCGATTDVYAAGSLSCERSNPCDAPYCEARARVKANWMSPTSVGEKTWLKSATACV